MFTGIIQAIGQVKSIQRFAADVRLEINANTLPLADIKLGDSIAINGACFTIVELQAPHFKVDASLHTLEKTTLKNCHIGQKVNLEKCLQLQSYLGGHLVTGHIDGVAELIEKIETGRAQELTWRIPTELMPFIAVKGSITMAGVSLTVNAVQNNMIMVTIIPHTSEQTTLTDVAIGESVNVEVDLLARYVARWLTANETTKDNREKWSALLSNLS